MAYQTPTFNLVCNVYTGPWLSKVLRIADLECNLALGRRVQQLLNTFTTLGNQPDDAGVVNSLLVPAGSDVRSVCQVPDPDLLEIPSGSGCWYQCTAFADVGKGFPNEYRIIAIAKIYERWDPVKLAGCFWPIPAP